MYLNSESSAFDAADVDPLDPEQHPLGWRGVGQALAPRLDGLADVEWSAVLRRMLFRGAQPTREQLWGWFEAALPRLAGEVPFRRREKFVDGLLDGVGAGVV